MEMLTNIIYLPLVVPFNLLTFVTLKNFNCSISKGCKVDRHRMRRRSQIILMEFRCVYANAIHTKYDVIQLVVSLNSHNQITNSTSICKTKNTIEKYKHRRRQQDIL